MKTQIKLKVALPIARCQLVAITAYWLSQLDGGVYNSFLIDYDGMWDHAKRQWPNQKVLLNKVKDFYEEGSSTDGISCSPDCWDVAEKLIDKRFPSLKEDE